jgi:nucleoid-associated protein YgaU
MNRYQNIPVIRNSQGIRYYKDSKYPQVPLSVDDIYVITTEGDRFDLLAQQYYGDSSLWWIISIANETLSQNSLFIPLGIQLRIPSNPSTVLINYASLNK